MSKKIFDYWYSLFKYFFKLVKATYKINNINLDEKYKINMYPAKVRYTYCKWYIRFYLEQLYNRGDGTLN